MLGILVGLVAAHWYYTQGESMRTLVEEMWSEASAPPPRVQNADPERPGTKGRR
jgi:hypothetical protein